MSRLPTVKIDLGDGDYVELNKHLLVKTQRAVQSYCLQYVPDSGELTPQILQGHEKELVRIFFTNQAEALRISVIKQYRLLGKLLFKRLVRLTFNPPFDYDKILSVLDEVGFDKLQIIEKEMNRLYSPDPLGQAPAGESQQKPS